MKSTNFINKVDYAEAEATKFGLEITENTGYLHLIIESDSHEVVDLVSFKKSIKAEIFWIVTEVQDRVKRLNQVKIQFTSRSCNGLAHSLAKLAL